MLGRRGFVPRHPARQERGDFSALLCGHAGGGALSFRPPRHHSAQLQLRLLQARCQQILCLLIRARGAKPVSIMKTLSGTFAFKLALLAVIAIVAVLTFRAFAQPSPTAIAAHKKFELNFGGPTRDEFVDVRQPDFDRAVKALADPAPGHGGKFEIRYKGNNNAIDDPYDPGHPHAQLKIKTDKITTSELAKNAPAEESLANDPNAVFRVQSNSATDIKNVLDTFK